MPRHERTDDTEPCCAANVPLTRAMPALSRGWLRRWPNLSAASPSRWTSTQASDPLRILFCGSDEFSCASLAALHHEHAANPGLIRSIDVVVRPYKPVGRGNKNVREGQASSCPPL